MYILIYGADGWIGTQFTKLLDIQSINYIVGKSRCDDNGALTEEITHIKPTHVISFIGRTHGVINGKTYPTIDYLEQPTKLNENIRDNLFSPLLLAHVCILNNIHYTYLGTGCIFTFDDEHSFGDETKGFIEDSKPNFFGSSYSIVKGYTDQLMKLYPNVLNLRIRMPITDEPNPRNFITKIVTYEKICSIPNSMSVLPTLLPYVVKMMQDSIIGTLNFTNHGLISHNEILEMYKELVNPNFTWENFSSEEQRKILESDRSNNYLDTTKLNTLYPSVPSIKDAIRECLIIYAQKMYN